MQEIPIIQKFKPIFDMEQSWRNIFLYGGRMSSKSVHGAIYLLIRGLYLYNKYNKPVTIVCLRPTQIAIKDSFLQELKNVVTLYPVFDRYYEYGLNYFRGKNIPVNFVFKGANRNPEDIKGISNGDIFLIEEADTISKEAIDIIKPTVRKEGSTIIWIFNPSTRSTPMSKYMLRLFKGNYTTEIKDKNIAIFTNYKDNTFLSSSSEYEISLAKNTYPPLEFNNIYNGEYIDVDINSYYADDIQKMYLENRYKNIYIDYSIPYYALVDLGYSDKTVFWIVQYYGDMINIIDLIYSSGKSIDYYIDLIKNKGYINPFIYIQGDANQIRGYTSTKTVTDIFNSSGLKYKIIPFFKNDRYTHILKTKRIFNKLIFNTTPQVKEGLDLLSKYKPDRNDNVPHTDIENTFSFIGYMDEQCKGNTGNDWMDEIFRMKGL